MIKSKPKTKCRDTGFINKGVFCIPRLSPICHSPVNSQGGRHFLQTCFRKSRSGNKSRSATTPWNAQKLYISWEELEPFPFLNTFKNNMPTWNKLHLDGTDRTIKISAWSYIEREAYLYFIFLHTICELFNSEWGNCTSQECQMTVYSMCICMLISGCAYAGISVRVRREIWDWPVWTLVASLLLWFTAKQPFSERTAQTATFKKTSDKRPTANSPWPLYTASHSILLLQSKTGTISRKCAILLKETYVQASTHTHARTHTDSITV